MVQLKKVINSMVDNLGLRRDGTWRELTNEVNTLAANLTTQVRSIAEVTTAVAKGLRPQAPDSDVSSKLARNDARNTDESVRFVHAGKDMFEI
ncbi:hypothetical protein GGX14DRAFT_669354 [Mycena pura]|uniref:Uncharacterized protein n=1 Tax=Mycena pura TaxID=153505 RepID=A0AAD6VSB2_9AGAR|nr:hypothetical protein GGX14DRAFT_669354 [Mycena pura]